MVIRIFSYTLLLVLMSGGHAVDPVEIIRKSEQQIRASSSISEMDITIIRPKYTRTISMKSWTKGEKYGMSLITAPAKDKGIVFLKRDREVWNWVPSIERTIKLPPSMMSQSWMGTDLTNDDLVRQTSLTEDFTHTLHANEKIGDRECYKISLNPKETASVVWDKVIMWIDIKDYIQLKSEFYDEDGLLVNTFSGTDIKKFGSKMLASRYEMIPTDKPGNKTVLTYKSLQFDVPMTDDFFTPQNMKKVK